MLKRLASIFGISNVSEASASAAKAWPALPSHGFISGRPAHDADVEAGDAIFVAAMHGTVIGNPLPVAIPQYASMRDTGEHVILVQAEEANGIKLFGVRGLDGREAVVKDSDIELLGSQEPT